MLIFCRQRGESVNTERFSSNLMEISRRNLFKIRHFRCVRSRWDLSENGHFRCVCAPFASGKIDSEHCFHGGCICSERCTVKAMPLCPTYSDHFDWINRHTILVCRMRVVFIEICCFTYTLWWSGYYGNLSSAFTFPCSSRLRAYAVRRPEFFSPAGTIYHCCTCSMHLHICPGITAFVSAMCTYGMMRMHGTYGSSCFT